MQFEKIQFCGVDTIVEVATGATPVDVDTMETHTIKSCYDELMNMQRIQTQQAEALAEKLALAAKLGDLPLFGGGTA